MKRIDGIDITRGLLALSVAIYHYIQFLDITYLKKIHALITLGITSVDGFFMISGFALFYCYHKVNFTEIKNLTSYFYKRFCRIAPLFYLCMLLNIVSAPMVLIIISLLLFLGFTGEKRNSQWTKYSFLLISLVLFVRFLTPLTSPHEKLILLNNVLLIFGFLNPNLTQVGGGWSIGIECVFYFTLPFIVCLTKNTIKYLTVLILFSVFLAINYQLLNNTNLFSYNSTEHFQELLINWPLYTNPINHFYFFMGGILLFIFYEHYQEMIVDKQQWLIKIMVALIFIYFFLDQFVGNASYSYGRFFYSLLTMTIISLTPFMIIKNNWLRTKLVLLGDISYSVYLMQFPVYNGVIYLTKKFGLDNKVEIFFIALLCLLLISYFTYRWYELPSKKWLMDINSEPSEKKSSLLTTG